MVTSTAKSPLLSRRPPLGPSPSSSPSPWLSPSSCLSSPSAPPLQAVSGTGRNNAAAATRTGNFVIGLSPQEGPHRSGRSGDRFPRTPRGRSSSPRPIGHASGYYWRQHPDGTAYV